MEKLTQEMVDQFAAALAEYKEADEQLKNPPAKKTELAKAVETLQDALRLDSEFYYAWQSNIAVSIQDELKDLPLGDMNYHEFSNKAAKRFLDLLINN